MNRRGGGLAALAALLVIVATNAVTLGLAAWNPVGGPESHLQLAARDFERPDRRDRSAEDGNGPDLILRWRVATAAATVTDTDALDASPWRSGSGPADWLDDAKLTTLGFPPPGRPAPTALFRARPQDARPVVLVLEFDGPAYRAALLSARRHHEAVLRQLATHSAAEATDRRQNADRQLREMETASTRLYVVDAGLDENALRARYPDRSRYALVHGRIAAPAGTAEAARRRGEVHAVDVGPIHVPPPLRQRLAVHLARAEAGGELQFSAPVAFGRRFEPWLDSLTP